MNEAINRFAPNVEPVITSRGKIIYNNQETGISVVYDKNGNYFRIEDTTRPRGRNYLDINGNDMNNEIVNEKHEVGVERTINGLHILIILMNKENCYGKE